MRQRKLEIKKILNIFFPRTKREKSQFYADKIQANLSNREMDTIKILFHTLYSYNLNLKYEKNISYIKIKEQVCSTRYCGLIKISFSDIRVRT